MPRDEHGQATVELALCLPFVAVVLAGVVEVGMLVSDQVRLWHAAREAARVAVVDPDPRAALEAAQRTGLEDLRLHTKPERAYRVQGRPLTVSVTYVPDGHVPLVGTLVRALELRAQASMRIEQP